MQEFDLIHRYFDWAPAHPEVALAVGDDAAILAPPPGQHVVIATDMLIAGRHFPESTAPEAIAHKALAVNLSDLAAMGAIPLGFTLSLGLPEIDESWLQRFSAGLRAAADRWGCDLVGGDTVRASRLTLSITAFGSVAVGKAIRRGGAQAGDRLAVTGTIGDAALGLMLALETGKAPANLLEADGSYLRERLDCPEPRLSVGRALSGVARAGLDVSDGLLQDLGHMLSASGLSAEIDLDAIPLSPAARRWLEADPTAIDHVLGGGDDYELLLVLPPELPLDPEWGLTLIGRLDDAGAVGEIRERAGRPLPGQRGYDHFTEDGA
ncbi:thiamine-phosphate kinase [Guyparkeria halophila]|uniref:Thiamine-monophosphate kinase n=1 Tax=Guyparkeria halophila TaxID=47960 RepID=A0ABZ0YXJ4_9GAMM|nr:thiamine-phosphate kinase [Guyparkeria halophila]WQH16890.1 thiamine-phosphate kinase [Guyparkeria halophila]